MLQFLVFKAVDDFSMSMLKTMQIMFVIPFLIYSLPRRNVPVFVIGAGMLAIVAWL